MIRWIFAAVVVASAAGGCKQEPAANKNSESAIHTLTLDWRPEPEFGGFYAASMDGDFRKHDIAVEIKPAGGGAPIWQLVATGKSDFGTTSADQVMIGRSKGADVVAIFAVYQKSPQGIMVHSSRGFGSIKDVWEGTGSLGAEDNSWLQYLKNKFGPPRVRVTGPPSGVGLFLADKEFSQQCFITSEPILAERQKGDPRAFLIADEGFNPYVTVVVTSGKLAREQPVLIQKMTAACREGWRAYLDNPGPTNREMRGLNPSMDEQTFADAAAAQKPLIETDETRKDGLGIMTAERWKSLGQQLVDLKVIDKAPAAEECFINPK